MPVGDPVIQSGYLAARCHGISGEYTWFAGLIEGPLKDFQYNADRRMRSLPRLLGTKKPSS